MALDTTTPRPRRALLAASVGGLAAWLAAALARPEPARAGVDGDVVLGSSNVAATETSLYNTANNNAVFSGTSNGSGTGVYGQSVTGYGVRGVTTGGSAGYYQADTGTGVYTRSTSGFALYVNGKATFSRAGRTLVPAGKSYVDIVPSGGLGGSATILATLQVKRAGVYVAAVRRNYPAAGKARIYLNKVASSTKSTPVGWFVIG